MKLIKPSFEILESKGSLKDIELAARTCYQSQGKITEDDSSAITLVDNLLKRNHMAMMEFGENIVLHIDENLYLSLLDCSHLPFYKHFNFTNFSSSRVILSVNPRSALEFMDFVETNNNLYYYDLNIHKLTTSFINYLPVRIVNRYISVFTDTTEVPYNIPTLDFEIEKLVHKTVTVKFVVDRAIANELVRHRHCSFAQKSTRYCDEKGDIEFIEPCWDYEKPDIFTKDSPNFEHSLRDSEYIYKHLRHDGWKPEQARNVLPNALATEIIINANLQEWKHIFELRCDKASHPQMREIMIPLQEEFKQLKLI